MILAVGFAQIYCTFANEQFVGNAFMHSVWVMVLRRCVESKNVDSFRRERIYPFRPRSGITAPNYLTKGQVIRISSQIYDKNIRKSGFADGMSKPIPKGVYGPFPVQRTMDVHQPFGTDKSVPYEIHRQIPICWAVLAEGRRNCGGLSSVCPSNAKTHSCEDG